MKYDVAPRHRVVDDRGIGDVAADLFDSESLEAIVASPLQGSDHPAPVDEPPHDGATEKSAPTRDQSPHPEIRGAAQKASAVRPILALCRMSTGKPG